MNKMHKIYVATNKGYAKDGLVKVGLTDRTVAERLKELDTTGNRYPWYALKEWYLPLTDKKIHNQLERMGIYKDRIDADREFFKCGVADVDIAINQLLHGISRPNSYDARPEQIKAVEKAVSAFKMGAAEFLINAKMRFGKTFVSYLIAKALGIKNILILTYKPAVNASWQYDLDNHVLFDGWKYSSGQGYKMPHGAKVNVLFASFQDINELAKTKWIGIQKQHFDLVIVDEMHYGSDTDRAKFTLNSLSYDKALYVSGTPLDAIISGRFTEENMFSWSYVDEARKRRAEKESGWKTEVYRWLPEMAFHTFAVCDEAKKASLAYTGEEQFTMTKMFGSDNGIQFNDNPTVKLFIDQLFGRGSTKKSKSPIRTCAADHMLFVMPPSVDSVNAMCNTLQQLVGNEYHIINVAGKNISSLDKVKRLIAHHNKTITVTCGRFNTGVTVPEWDAVFMLGDGEAPETYFQTIFRVQSPDEKRRKEQCFVFDFNPERVLKLVYTYCELTAKNGQSISQAVREFIEFCPIIDHSGNTLKQIDAESIVSFVTENGSYIDKFTSSYLFNRNLAAAFTGLLDLSGGVVNVKDQLLVNSNNIDKGKNYLKKLVHKGPKTKQQKALEDVIIEKAKLITKNIPEYVLFVDPVDSVEKLLKTNKKLFEEHFNIKLDMFREMVNTGFMNNMRINRLIAGLEKLS
jgi:superfamily II DNA or RNA helicase